LSETGRRKSIMSKSTYLYIASALSIFLTTGLMSTTSGAARVDHSVYGELLEKYVKGGVVDYQGFKDDETRKPD
jgi:hypothetical protein